MIMQEKEKVLQLTEEQRHNSMRGWFCHALHEEMRTNSNIYFVTADLGYGMLTNISRDFPERVINCGAAEMAAVDVSIGLALEGKKPLVYTITSFLMRAAEPIALYLQNEGIPVVLLGGGRDQDYEHDGPSHDAKWAQDYIHLLGIKEYYPKTNEGAAKLVKEVIKLDEPAFISLRR